MRNIQKVKKEIIEILENLSDSDLLYIQNEVQYYDCIYDMDYLDEILENETASEIARKIFHGDFNPNDRYFTFNGYGNLKSFDYLDEEEENEEENEEEE